MAIQAASGLGSEALQESAEAIVERALEQGVVAEVEASVGLTVNSFARFADSGPTQSAERARLDVSLLVRVERDGRLHQAGASGQSLEVDDVDALMQRAISIAEVSPPLEAPVTLGGPVELGGITIAKHRGAVDPDTISHDPAAKAEAIARAVAACADAGVAPAGLFDTTGKARALANSSGRSVRSESSRASFALTATELHPLGLGGAGWAECIRARVGDLDVDGVIARAIQKSAPGVERGKVEPGEYTVVLEPAAVSAMLLFAAYYGFGAKEVEEQSSFLCGRIGEQLFPKELGIRDRWNHPMYPTAGFDGEGTPKKPVPLLQNGALVGPVTDRRYAQRLTGSADASTGHGFAQPTSTGPGTTCLSVDAGDQTMEQLVGGVERGLLVTQFHYTNVIDPREMLLTGMTRNGLFLIEDGQVVRPLKNLRFTESLLKALGNVRAIGSELEISGALFDGEVIAPPLAIDNFRFTSATDF
ncbi:MAG: metallopeptidase TldD-related protein [Planctomycetota bacterium]|nr:metallopeptidase TldD-related protein [Planctomycetota bacterium]